MKIHQLVLILILQVFIIPLKGNHFKEVIIENKQQKSFSLSNLSLVSIQDLYTDFPYEKYIAQMNYSDIKQLNEHLEELEKITKNEFLAQSIFSLCFTSKLKNLQTQELDSLYSVLLWADKLYETALLEGKNKEFYQSIPSFWYNYTSNTLLKISTKNNDIKFTFKYQYLIQKCAEKGYFTQGNLSLTEKVLLNILEKKWTYLFYRFWNNTSFVVKIVLFLILFLAFILMYFGIFFIQKNLIHNNKLTNL